MLNENSETKEENSQEEIMTELRVGILYLLCKIAEMEQRLLLYQKRVDSIEKTLQNLIEESE